MSSSSGALTSSTLGSTQSTSGTQISPTASAQLTHTANAAASASALAIHSASILNDPDRRRLPPNPYAGVYTSWTVASHSLASLTSSSTSIRSATPPRLASTASTSSSLTSTTSSSGSPMHLASSTHSDNIPPRTRSRSHTPPSPGYMHYDTSSAHASSSASALSSVVESPAPILTRTLSGRTPEQTALMNEFADKLPPDKLYILGNANFFGGPGSKPPSPLRRPGTPPTPSILSARVRTGSSPREGRERTGSSPHTGRERTGSSPGGSPHPAALSPSSSLGGGSLPPLVPKSPNRAASGTPPHSGGTPPHSGPSSHLTKAHTPSSSSSASSSASPSGRLADLQMQHSQLQMRRRPQKNDTGAFPAEQFAALNLSSSSLSPLSSASSSTFGDTPSQRRRDAISSSEAQGLLWVQQSTRILDFADDLSSSSSGSLMGSAPASASSFSSQLESFSVPALSSSSASASGTESASSTSSITS